MGLASGTVQYGYKDINMAHLDRNNSNTAPATNIAGTDLNALSKEQLIALLQEQSRINQEQSQQHKKEMQELQSQSVKEQKSQIDIITRLRAHIKSQDTRINELNDSVADYKKLTSEQKNEIEELKAGNAGQKDVIVNALTFIKDNRDAFANLIKDNPPEDLYNLKEINSYLMIFLSNARIATAQLGRYIRGTYVSSQSESNKNYKIQSDSENSSDSSIKGSESASANNVEPKDSENTAPTYATYPDYTEHKDVDVAAASIVSHDDRDMEELSLMCDVEEKECCADSMSTLQSVQSVIELSGEIRKNNKNSAGVVLDPLAEERSILNLSKDSDITKAIKVPTGFRIRCYCPTCKHIHEFKFDGKVKRANEVKEYQGIDTKISLSAVQNLIGVGCGTTIEYNPALITAYDTYEVKTRSDDRPKEGVRNSNECDSKIEQSLNQEVIVTNQDRQNTPKTHTNESADNSELKNSDNKAKVNKKILQNICRHDGAVKSSHDIAHDLISYKGRNDIINPNTFDFDAFALLPCFNKCALSAGLMSALHSMFAMLSAPKSRITTMLNGLGVDWSRVHITDIINGGSRAFFHGVAEVIHNDMLYNCRSVIMDETTLKVRSQKTKSGYIKKSQLWCMATSWTEEVSATYFRASDSRNADNVLDLLDSKNPSSIDTITTDGYAGYDAAVEEFKKAGIDICHASCWTHARRPLHRYLTESGLLKIYNQYLLPDGCEMSAFMENLRKYEQKNKGAKSLSALNRDCLIVYYLINCLFYIDSSAWQEAIIKGTSFEDEIEKYRKNISSKVLDAIFDVVRHIIRENGNIVIKCSGSRHGRVKYRKSNQHAVSGPLIYLLNQETKLREFVDKPHIELSSSAAERAIRLGACARHSFQFLNHPDSAQAFADHLTIANTCTMNNVSFTQYTLWLMANIRYRIVQKLMLEGMQSHAVSLPKSRTEIIEDGDNKVKIRIGLYDKANKTIFDEISYEGLTPYDFKTLILSHGE